MVKRRKVTQESASNAEDYDYEKIGNIVAGLNFLRQEAERTGNYEIYALISSTFTTCFVVHDFIERNRERLKDL